MYVFIVNIFMYIYNIIYVLFLYRKRPIHTPLDLSAIFTQCIREEKTTILLLQ